MSESEKGLYHEQTDRKFVREVSGAYNLGEELKRLRSQPRVRKGSEIPFVDGPQAYSRHYIEPKHGHVNEALFYIIDGEGAEVHDGVRYEWEAGDVAAVHNNCVHQHFNRSSDRPARALVLKTKPMYMFMNMLFQKTVVPRQKEPAPGGEGFQPREGEK